jgi:hypothetical protein
MKNTVKKIIAKFPREIFDSNCATKNSSRYIGWGMIFIVLLAGCSIFSSSPKSVVEKFYKSIEQNDVKAMSEVATKETVELMVLFGSKVQAALVANGKIKSMTETINGDTAVVKTIFESGEEDSVDLIKVDGKWKVHVDMKNKGK